MASNDFTGTYRVLRTSGTQFGLDTALIIGDPEEEDVLTVVIVPPNQDPSTWTALYDGETESLAFELPKPARSLHLSRYSDPSGYAAVYGVVVMEDLRLALFSAEKEGAGGIGGGTSSSPPASSPASTADFGGTYLVTASVGAQFGLGSSITVTGAEGEPTTLTVTDALGRSVPVPTELALDPATGSLKGGATATLGEQEVPVFLQLSRLTVPQAGGPAARILYGLFTIGDPQQGGVVAGQDPGGPPTQL